MLEGKEIQDGFFNQGPREAYVVLGPDFDNSNIDMVYEEHITTRGITDYIDDWPSQAELDALFN